MSKEAEGVIASTLGETTEELAKQSPDNSTLGCDKSLRLGLAQWSYLLRYCVGEPNIGHQRRVNRGLNVTMNSAISIAVENVHFRHNKDKERQSILVC